MIIVREPPRRERAAHGSGLAAMATFFRKNACVLALLYAAFGLATTVNSCFAAWLPTFFIRNFGWTSSQIGATYGLILILAGTAGIGAGGWLADRLVGAGRKDGVLYTASWAVALIAPAAATVGMASSAPLSLVALSFATFLAAALAALVPVAYFQITPNEFRGQVLSLHVLLATLLGLGGGPVIIAALSERVFRNELAIGRALAIVTVCAAMLSLVCLTIARRMQGGRSRPASFLSPDVRRTTAADAPP
jgi:MFS family permease